MPDSVQANDANLMQPPPGRPHPPYHRWVDFLPGSKPDSPEDRHDDGSVLKRVSLDATATWCGDDEEDDDDYCYGDNDGRLPPNDGGGHGHGNTSSNPLDVEDTMMMLDWTDDDADHMDTGALPGLMMIDDYDQHHEDSRALLNEVFLGEAEVPSSPMRTECCWDHLDAPDDDDDDIDGDNNNNEDAKSAGSGAHCLEAARFSSSSPSSLSARGVTRTHSSGSSSAGSAASGSDAQLSLQELFEQRRAQLEASMERSRKSRKYLEKHIQQRASLASVLADIERSSRQIIVEVLSTADAAAAAAGRSGDEEDSGSHAGDGEHEEEHGRAAEEDEECSMVTVEV
jgi:hypothetical protein